MTTTRFNGNDHSLVVHAVDEHDKVVVGCIVRVICTYMRFSRKAPLLWDFWLCLLFLMQKQECVIHIHTYIYTLCICVEAKASYNMIMLHSTHLLFLYFCNKGMKGECSCLSFLLFSLEVKFS